MTNEHDRLRRGVRTQLAIVRAMTAEIRRHARPTDALYAQAHAESARLLTAMDTYSRTRAQPSSGPAPLSSRLPPSADERRVRVLLVDDDDAACSAIASWLARDYDVFTACDGHRGLKVAQQALPDAIVTDVLMPGMDGIAMVREIRALSEHPSIPVIILTALAAPENVTAGFVAGGAGYLVKPVDLELLDDELRWALAEGAG
jgi:CheY-like chemotaxis protein